MGSSSAPEPGRSDTRGEPPPDRSLDVSRRLTHSSEIQDVYREGRKQVGRWMVLWVKTGSETSMKVAVVASRKVGNSVKRSRAKRRLREVYRLHRDQLCESCDMVLVARAGLVSAPWPEVVNEFLKLAARAGVHK